jgi:dihydrolipoamide dehydrogenase
VSDFDLVVIGSGPGGYVAAIRASQLGLKTAIIERENLGGICLNWGCIPTKALLKSGEVFEKLSHLEDFGLSATGARADLARIVARSRGVAAQMNKGVAFLMKKHKVEVIEGDATLEKGSPAPTVQVKLKAGGARTVKARNVMLAVGARTRPIPQIGLEADGERIWAYREAMVPKTAPKSLVVIGSGAIGIEFASFFRTLGADTTVAEIMDRILPVEDEEISKFARKSFEKQGMKIHTGARVESLTPGKNNVAAKLALAGGKSETLTVDRVILAVGIAGNVENVGLEDVGVKVEKGHIVIDDYCRTNVEGIYAIGDVAGAPWLAHKGMHEGVVWVE